MRKFALMLAIALICSISYAQRPGGSSRVSSGSPSRSSVSVSHGSPSRSSSVATSRSSSTVSRSHGTSVSRSYTPSNRTSSTTRTSTRRSVSRSDMGTPSRTPSAGTPTGRDYKPATRTSSHDMGGRPSGTPDTPKSHGNGHHEGPGHNPAHHGHHVPHGMHPQPPHYHPIHHHHVHMHYCPVDGWFIHDCYWHGYWHYAHHYAYNDVVVYVRDNQTNTNLIAMVSDDLYVYSLYHDSWENKTYFTITDENDRMVVKTQVHRKYNKLMIGEGGVWLFKNKDRDPMFMSYIDGQLYKYEQD